jgi:hypothetical protein
MHVVRDEIEAGRNLALAPYGLAAQRHRSTSCAGDPHQAIIAQRVQLVADGLKDPLGSSSAAFQFVTDGDGNQKVCGK